jgi:cardiolipin synthase
MVSLEQALPYLNWVAVALGIMVSIAGAMHALFNKRDPRSAGAWVAICLMWPLVGAIIYLVFGKNRIKTRARQLHGTAVGPLPAAKFDAQSNDCSQQLRDGYQGLANLSAATSLLPLLGGNRLELLVNGEQAFPAMLDAIDSARHSIYFASYIFDGGGIGRRFIESLAAARARGVEVRVLIDGVGRLYSWPRAHRRLRKKGVPTALYLPTSLLPPRITINLRNHRKILVVDCDVAFTGGMNIRQHHLVESGKKRNRTEDIHFRLQGPVVEQLQAVFVSDWRFSSNLFINPPPLQSRYAGGACCRAIDDGPNDDVDKLLRILIGAIDAAREYVAIMTPYFLPEKELQVALEMAALRGVEVNIILPGKNNMPFVNWAAFHRLDELLKSGAKVHLYNGVFVHSKLFVADGYYVQVGSYNLDPRSLKLNFEIAVESYGESVAAPLADYFHRMLGNSRPLSSEWLASRSVGQRFGSAVFWLMSPYL